MARNRNFNTETANEEFGDSVAIDEATLDEPAYDGGSEETPNQAETTAEAAKRGFHGEAVTGALPDGFTLPEPDATARSNNNPITRAVRDAKECLGVWQATHVKPADVKQAKDHLRSSANRLNVGVHIHPAVGDSDQLAGGKAIYWHTKEKASRKVKDVSDTDGTAETSPESAPVESTDSEPAYADTY